MRKFMGFISFVCLFSALFGIYDFYTSGNLFCLVIAACNFGVAFAFDGLNDMKHLLGIK